MRIAFFGGTFDPPHRGHISIAKAARNRLALDQVLVAPVGAQPLKGGWSHSDFADRLAMVRLAIAGVPGLVASDDDAPLPDNQPNYTADTLARLRRRLSPSDELFCLVGADSFLTLKLWHESATLLLACDFIIAARPGFSLEQVNAALPTGISNTGEHRQPGFTRFTLAGASGQTANLFLLPDLDQDISATEIRAAVASGEDPQGVLDPAVTAYIREHNLYRPETC
jgi:nicotinate-nucleotide adenylyltransferase